MSLLLYLKFLSKQMIWFEFWLMRNCGCSAKRYLLRACFVGGTRFEPFYGMEAFVPSLQSMRQSFRDGAQAAKLAKVNEE